MYELLYGIREQGSGSKDAENSFSEIRKTSILTGDSMRELGNVIDNLGRKTSAYTSTAMRSMGSLQAGYASATKARLSAAEKETAGIAAEAKKQASNAKAAIDEQVRADRSLYQLREKIWKDETAAKKRELDQQVRDSQRADQQSGQAVRGISQMAGISGGAGSYGMAAAMGGGMLATGGALAVAAAVGGIASITKDSMQAAQELTNLAHEFGTTTTQMAQFQAAARLSGQDMGNMTQALRHVSEAIAEPGTKGKEMASMLHDMGISIEQGPAEVLKAFLIKLNDIPIAAQKNIEAAGGLGRSFMQWAEASRHFGEATEVIGPELTAKLTAANIKLAEFNNQWIVIRGTMAGVAVDTLSVMAKLDHYVDLAAMATNLASGRVLIRPVPGTAAEQQAAATKAASGIKYAPLGAMLRATDTRDEQEQLLYKLKGQLANAIGKGNAHYGVDSEAVQAADMPIIAKLRADVASMEAKMHPNNRGVRAQAHESLLDQEMEDKLILNRYPGLERPLGEAEVAARRRLRSLATDKPSLSARDYQHDSATANQLIGEERKDAQDRVDAALRLNANWMVDYERKNNTKMVDQQGKIADRYLTSSLKESARDENELRENGDAYNQYAGRISSENRRGSLSLSSTLGTNSPGSEYQSRIAEAQQLFSLEQTQINRQADGHKKELESAQNLYKFIEEADNARIERAEKIAAIGKKQQEDAGQFASSWIMASITGKRGAAGEYLRGFGEQMFSHIVSNTAETAMGPGGLNNFVGLGRTGMLGPDASHRNMLGNMLKGTPLDFTGKQQGGDLVTVTGTNTDATIENTKAIIAWMTAHGMDTSSLQTPSGSSGGKGAITAPAVTPIWSKFGANISGMDLSEGTHAAGAAGSALLQAISGGRLGRSSRDAEVSMSMGSGDGSNLHFKTRPGEGGDPAMASETKSAAQGIPNVALEQYRSGLSLLLPTAGAAGLPGTIPPINPYQETRGGGGSDGGGGGNTSEDAANAAGGTPIGRFFNSGAVFGSAGGAAGSATGGSRAGGEPTLNKMDSITGSLQGGANLGITHTIGDSISKALSNVSSLVGTTGKLISSGKGLEGVLTGKVDYGNGTGQAFTGIERTAAGAAIAGAGIAGGITAAKDFSRGGAKGITGGIGAIAGAAATVDPTGISALVAVSAGILSSLLPDPRAQRIKQEQATLVNDAFIKPAARDFDFGGGSPQAGGFTTGYGGALQAGGPSQNYTVHLNSLNAKSFTDLAKSNPSAFSEAILAGVSDGGDAALSAEIAFRSQYGGFIPPGGLTAG